MVQKISIILLAIALLFGCAGQQIVQDKSSTPDKCFQSKVNPFNFPSWKQLGRVGQAMLIENPDKDALPKVVIITIHPMYHVIWRYAYLDGKNVKAYIASKEAKCYIAEKITPKIEQWLKDVLKKALKQKHVNLTDVPKSWLG